ncbi:MAG: amino acid dehydrogenase, partial [Shewanella sp.]
AKSEAKVREIYHTLLEIFAKADEQNRTTGAVADEMAKAIIQAAKK